MKLINLIILNSLLVLQLSAENTIDNDLELDILIASVDTLYVNHAAMGNNDGSDWANAFADLQTAIDNSANCPNSVIWLAEGTYAPTKANIYSDSNNARDTTFLIESPVKIYGGFSSGATALSERDSISGNTILTGILSGGDTAYNVIFIRDDAITC